MSVAYALDLAAKAEPVRLALFAVHGVFSHECNDSHADIMT